MTAITSAPRKTRAPQRAPLSPDQDRLYRLAHVKAITGHGHATIYGWIRQGAFPAPKKIGASSVWPKSEIDQWLRSHGLEAGA